MATSGPGAAGTRAAVAEAAAADAAGANAAGANATPIRRREIRRPAPVDLDAETDRQLQRAVWALAWPSVLTMMLQVGNSFLDRFFVGSLGPDALAAVGVGSQVMFLLFSVGMSISIGTTALVARFAGADEIPDARTAANQSVWLGVLAAVVCAALMMPARVSIVGLLGVDRHASILCSRYLAITILGVPALFMMLILSSVFRGLGDTVRPLVVMIGVNLIHLGGDYLLIFGHFGFPRLGLMGGALALLTSQVVGASLYVLFLRRSVVAGFLRCQSRLHLDWSRRILRIGFPAALQNASRNLSMLAFTAVLARTPDATAAVAALTIGLTSESIAFMPGFGFSTAASTLTGQNLGAGNPPRAERAAWMALQQGLVIMTIMAFVFYHWAPEFAAIFTGDTRVAALAIAYLRTLAYSEPLLAVGMILNGALNGAGDTRAPAWASFFSMWAVRLPLAYAATRLRGMGAVGGWWAMAISTMLNGVIAYIIFRGGRWKHIRV